VAYLLLFSKAKGFQIAPFGNKEDIRFAVISSKNSMLIPVIMSAS